MIIIGVCGASGSGKSTLARKLCEKMGSKCRVIGQDCYYRSFPHIPFEERCHLNYDDPEIFDFDEMLADMKELAAGRSITTKGYDYTNHIRSDSDALIEPPEILILEGIHMFHDKRLCNMMALKIYIKVDADICLLRRVRRDMKARGRSIDSITEQYLATVKPMYEKHIARYIEDADFAVMRGGKNDMAIELIAAWLREKTCGE